MYKAAIKNVVAETGRMPAFVTGRLATLYRSLGQLDDEVALLERYQQTETSETTHFRFVARLAKARALAERSRVRDSGALASIRAIPPSSLKARREARMNGQGGNAPVEADNDPTPNTSGEGHRG